MIIKLISLHLTLLHMVIAYTDAHADTFPPIRPGMWESTFEMPSLDSAQPKKMTAKQCHGDHESVADLFNRTKETLKGQCEEMKFLSNGSNYSATIICDLGISKITVKSTAMGDFQSSYSMQSTTTFNPALFGQTNQVSSGKGRYLGPCEPDTKPGDIITEDGRKMNIKDLGKMANLSPEQKSKIAAQQAKANQMLKNMDPKLMQQLMQQLGKK